MKRDYIYSHVMSLVPPEVLDCVPTPVIVVDAKRRALHANRAARDLLGNASLGRDLALSLRHPDVLDAIDQILAGADEKTGEITLHVPVLSILSFHVERLKGAPLQDGSVAAVVLNDVTASKKAEEMRADFVANVSHELRSPLTALIGFIETLRGPASDDTTARVRFLNIMHRESQRMARLIDDLLSLSRVEINEHVRPRKTMDVVPVLKSVVEFLEPQAAKRHITITLTTEIKAADVTGDNDQLNQVFRNLVENAIKYGSEHGKIEVTLRTVERIPGTARSGFAISVADDGDGIPKELIPRLTERFFRIDKARSSGVETGINSTGLGLAIVKHIVSRHRGHLSVESGLGQGSTFTVFLPSAG